MLNDLRRIPSTWQVKNMETIEKRSLSEQAAEIIRKQILSREIKPGTRLIVDVLAEKIGVSRTPVREGLHQLTTGGLVVYNGNQYMVRKFTRKDVEEIYEIRLALEVLAVQHAALSISKGDLQKLAETCEKVKECVGSSTPDRFSLLDLRFHNLISKGTNNIRLQNLLSEFREQVRCMRHWVLDYPELAEQVEAETFKEHRAILNALRLHDREKSGDAMKNHLEKGRERTLRGIEN